MSVYIKKQDSYFKFNIHVVKHVFVYFCVNEE